MDKIAIKPDLRVDQVCRLLTALPTTPVPALVTPGLE